ncbi:hypothetical protein F4779DRAFT_619213 [Xylariaceae sp. FL0662B]|nr:hypothetical protein F4779DRAFT_619213 [Xylariaceae sp. FL0662B]
MDDPWDWGVDRVVQEFCSPVRSWDPPSLPLKLPPLEQLEASLREHEVDGHTLLTYDHTELFGELGIKILKHRATFKHAISSFRSRSKQFRLYQKRQFSDVEPDIDTREPGEDDRRKKLQAELASVNANTANGNIWIEDVTTLGSPKIRGSDDDDRRWKLRNELDLLNTNSVHSNSPSRHVDVSTPNHADTPSLTTQTPTSEEPVRKKRRVVPTIISTDAGSNVTRNIPTEADMVLVHRPHQTNSTRVDHDELDLARAYLGKEAITRVDFIEDLYFVKTAEPLQLEDREINFFQDEKFYSGRRLQVSRFWKRRLLRNWEPRQAQMFKSDAIPGANNPEHDELLPLLGDSDSDAGYDSETWNEMEAEKIQRAKTGARTGLTADEINEVLDEAIQQFASEWRERKLTKLAHQANRKWRDARKFGLKMSIDKNRRELHELESRIAKCREDLVGNSWRSKSELKQITPALQQTVEDREYASWMLSIIASPTEPDRLPSLPRRSIRKPKAAKPKAEDDEEILTSESEGELDDFVVDDEPLPPSAPSEDSPMDVIEDDDFSEIQGQAAHENNRSHGPSQTKLQEQSANENHQAETPADAEQSDMMDLQQAVDDASHFRTPTKSRITEVIDLITPEKLTLTPNKLSNSKRGSPKISRKENELEQKGSTLIMSIDDLEPAEQMVAKELAKLDAGYLSFIFTLAVGTTPKEIWLDLVLVALDYGFPKPPYETGEKKDRLVAYILVRLFEMRRDNCFYPLRRYKQLDFEGKGEIRNLRTDENSSEFDAFVDFLHRLSDRFEWNKLSLSKKAKKPPAVPTPGMEEKKKKKKQDADKATSKAPDSEEGSDIDNDEQSPSKRRRHKIVRNREAANLRETDRARIAEQDHRRQMLLARLQQLEASGAVSLGSQNRMIINESKTDEQGFIYIHDEIAPRIKEHQVAGVRFMWNQVVDFKMRQGCLLAHTMGLGKTMQIITLLVAIAQAAESDNPTVSSQIPQELRESGALVLCPPGLVNNWMDELLTWAPEGHGLGEFFKIDGTSPPDQREQIIYAWDGRGGILIIGYNLFKQLFDNEELREILTQRPNIVVADEAHMLKNPKSQLHIATADFRTQSRIALTGSPLANNVEEYHAMINWVAPNYLSDIREFRSEYARPIKEGLSVDSTKSQRRKALTRLRVLKEEVAPKVDRRTISVLKHDIPTKQEFVLTVPLTNIQRAAYELYIRHQQESSTSAKTFSSVGALGLLCAHPEVFKARLEAERTGFVKGKNRSDEMANVTLSEKLVSDEMALLRKEKDLNEITQSWKIPILVEILEECKRLGDAVLLFSHSIGTLDYLEQVLRKMKSSFDRLDGSTNIEKRQSMVKEFNKNQIDVFLISTTAGGLGLNIVGANRVILFDIRFNPQNEQQAVGRAYRIGQKKPVFVYRFVCGGTFEEKMLNQSIWKMQLASRVVDKKNPIPKAQRFGEGFEMPTEPEQKDIDEHIGKDSVLDKVIEKHRPGIRSITMMDTFEEEELEDADLTAEDRAEADSLISLNAARRFGIPIAPPNPINTHGTIYDANNGTYGPVPQVLVGTQGVTFTQERQAKSPVSLTAEGVLQTHGSRDAQRKSNSPAHPGSSARTQVAGDNNPNYTVAQPHVSLQPVQVQGTTTHIGRPTDHLGRTLANQDTIWESLPAFKGELTRSFTKGNNPVDPEVRRHAAQTLTAAIWDRNTQKPSELQASTKWAVMNAASSPRFIEAVCIGLVAPDQLAEMDPKDITTKCDTWDRMPEPEWETEKKTTGHQTEADPEHLHNALYKMSSTTRDEEHELGQQKPHRVDDQRALEAVLERRRAKQSSHVRLPNWARDAVARSGRIAPPSSASTTLSPSTSASRPLPKSPFK